MKSILEQNLRDVVFTAIGHAPPARALIVYDRESPLSNLLTDAYAAVLPDATLLDFLSTTPDAVRAAMDAMSPGDLVVMVQSTSFRLNEFRFRIELFKRGLAVIEHPHVARIVGDEVRTYVDALAYDAEYYRTVGPKIKALIDAAKRIVVSCDGAELVYETAFETAKLNIGDYSGMTNRGGQFPIGEVFTEPADLSGVNGTVKLFAFGGADFRVTIPEEPVLVVIKEGKIVETPNAPESFLSILEQIKTEEELWVRELGFGMNRALTRHRFLCDVGSYERMCGIHLSLGAKHTIYAKPGFPKRTSRFHVDVFADVKTVTIDGVTVFKDGSYRV